MRSNLQIRQISLRGAIVWISFIAGLLAMSKTAVDRAAFQSIAVAKIHRTSGAVHYDYHLAAPQWCIDWLGPDFFATVKSVSYFESGIYRPHAPENHRNYTAIQHFPHLEEVDIFDSYFPVDVLQGISGLQRLRIEQNGLRDNDIDIISQLTTLRILKLPRNDITDAGAKKLAQLKNLSELDLSQNNVSTRTIANLRLAIPECLIKD